MFTAVAVLAAYVFDGNDATAARHWELTGECWPIGNDITELECIIIHSIFTIIIVII